MFETLYYIGAVITFAILLLGMRHMHLKGEDVKMNQIVVGVAMAVIPIVNLGAPIVVLFVTIMAILNFTVIRGKK